MDPLAILPTCSRATSEILNPLPKTPSFFIDRKNKSYKHQYSNIYFVRLRLLRKYIEERAERRWKHASGHPVFIPRVLEIVKSQLCYIIGTVYMDMPLKPNILEDIARDHGIPPPPPKPKFWSLDDSVMLEDESGRIRLTGELIRNEQLVTGVIIGVLGTETSNGDFEVKDICYPGMAPQDQSCMLDMEDEMMDVDEGVKCQDSSNDSWIAVVSGLDIGSLSPPDAQIQMLVEFLTGEEGSVEDQTFASRISRLIIAGNSLVSPSVSRDNGENHYQERKARKYGHVDASFSPHPVTILSKHLFDIASTMPIHILPGEADPSGVIMPQQPFPRAMMGKVALLKTFYCETNPTYLRIGHDPGTDVPPVDRTILVNSGQPLNDMFKYLPTPPHTRLSILESTLRWRHMAPTAPDTLWCHPYFGGDPFIITQTPDLYIVGNQKRFATRMVLDVDDNIVLPRARCRIVMVPTFAKSGVLVLINLRNLEVKTVRFAVEGMAKGNEDDNAMGVEGILLLRREKPGVHFKRIGDTKSGDSSPPLASLEPSQSTSQHSTSSGFV